MNDDHELMRRCGNGDMAAMEAIVRRWESRVDAMCRRLVPIDADASDLKQETFVRVLLASDRYRAKGEFSTWLYRIVLNLVRDHTRRRKARPTDAIADLQLESNVGSPEFDCERMEARNLIDQAVRSLTTELKEVLVLRHYGEMTFIEISRLLSRPESTVKSQLAAALKQLQLECRKRGLDNGDQHEL